MKHKAVFLDRDGVLNNAVIRNGKPYPPTTLEELIIPSDAKSALEKLKSKGFLLIVATNQPDVARKKTLMTDVEMINNYLKMTLALDDIRVCYHDDIDECTCRKPKPGLITQAAAEHDIHLPSSFMIGDRCKDIEAGKKAGCKTIWLCNDYDEPKPERSADFIASSLSEAVDWIERVHAQQSRRTARKRGIQIGPTGSRGQAAGRRL